VSKDKDGTELHESPNSQRASDQVAISLIHKVCCMQLGFVCVCVCVCVLESFSQSDIDICPHK
jgi:hypothetical protein